MTIQSNIYLSERVDAVYRRQTGVTAVVEVAENVAGKLADNIANVVFLPKGAAGKTFNVAAKSFPALESVGSRESTVKLVVNTAADVIENRLMKKLLIYGGGGIAVGVVGDEALKKDNPPSGDPQNEVTRTGGLNVIQGVTVPPLDDTTRQSIIKFLQQGPFSGADKARIRDALRSPDSDFSVTDRNLFLKTLQDAPGLKQEDFDALTKSYRSRPLTQAEKNATKDKIRKQYSSDDINAHERDSLLKAIDDAETAPDSVSPGRKSPPSQASNGQPMAQRPATMPVTQDGPSNSRSRSSPQ
ncbi:hypothetical protein FRB99_008592 [Tulasnella sp. 403]|nr:hypothetical protein FRB99_008592 [Tulasnella sp. 403]